MKKLVIEDMPEIELFREYKSNVDFLWDDIQKLQLDKFENDEEKEETEAYIKKGEEITEKLRNEITKRIIKPRVKDESLIKKAFTKWCRVWNNFIEEMPKSEYNIFELVEENFELNSDKYFKEYTNYRPKEDWYDKITEEQEKEQEEDSMSL